MSGRRVIGGRPLAITIVLPRESDALQGARLGIAEAQHAARLLGRHIDVHEIDETDGTIAIVRALALPANIVIGGADDAAATALGRAAPRLDALLLDACGSADALRMCDSPLFHITASTSMQRDARAHAVEEPAPNDVVEMWHPTLSRYGAAQLNRRYHDRFGTGMTSAAWAGWCAVKVAWEAALRADSNDPAELARFLTSERAVFDGHKGVPLSFRSTTRQLRQPLYVLRGDRLLAEVPSPALAAEMRPAELLDRIGAAPACSP